MADDNKSGKTIIGNQGIITEGQIGNNTIIHGPIVAPRAEFTEALRSALLTQIPKGRVMVKAVGNNQMLGDSVADRITAFLKEHGYQAEMEVVVRTWRPLQNSVSWDGSTLTVVNGDQQ